jgi:hypothetical protein
MTGAAGVDEVVEVGGGEGVDFEGGGGLVVIVLRSALGPFRFVFAPP